MFQMLPYLKFKRFYQFTFIESYGLSATKFSIGVKVF